MFFKKIKYGAVVLSVVMTASCAALQKPVDPPPQEPLPFDHAVRWLAKHLLYQIVSDTRETEGNSVKVLAELFTDSVSGEVSNVSLQIEKIILEEGRQSYPDFRISRLSSSDADDADYIIEGIIQPDNDIGSGSDQIFIRVSAGIINIAEGKIIGNSEVRIAEPNLDFTPLAIYRDSPLFDPRGKISGKEHTDKIKIRALLSDAKSAYEEGDYQKALDLFTAALNSTDKPGIIIFTGLYLSNSKLGRTDDAEKAFQNLLAVSVQQYKVLTVKFLFEVNSVRFADALKEEYQMWLRQIGAYFKKSSYCIVIEGHSSCTGSESWNKELSSERAKIIQKQMQDVFPDITKRSRVVGIGSGQNIVGSCSDDQRDSLDRRVEIKIVDCQ